MKNSLREEHLSLRKGLSRRDVTTLSNKVFFNLKGIPEYSRAKSLMVYLDYKNEVETKEIIEDVLRQNKNAIIPISKPDTLELHLSNLISIQDLEVSTYGILEPKKDKIFTVLPEIIDIVIVPGVVFDKNGYRIGYGKGYYDRFLSSLDHKFIAIGICYDFQLIDEVPKDIYDYQLDYIVTDERIINTRP